MPESQLRAAVVGAGWYAAQNHIPALAARPEVVLDGVCRLGRDELERVRDHFGFAFASERFEDVLARKPDIVVVASPHQLHYRHAAAALEAGAHVLCEKPLTLDPAEAWDLVAKAEARGRHLVTANGYQYLPRVDDLRRRIAEGAVGAIEHVMVSFISATRDVFTGERGLDTWRTTFFRPDRSTWQDPANGGGFAYGQLSHALAMMYFLTGLEPEAITAFAVSSDRVDIAEAGALRFTTGAVASISGAAAMPQGNRGLLRLFITGDAGLLTVEFDRDACEIRRFSGEVEHLPLEEGDWVYRCDGPVNTLVDLALGQGANLSPGVIGARTAATIAALLQSAAARGAVQPVLGRRS
ncbi:MULTISPECIES: Gfo/Idh/MocA family oxidoreductase [unclassified Chelatococcus]|uniref:Gfo/Idh/MocA family protein n=1 Tax=unclassified Chelatococcus TaxID=2638111 RepID=UPI001BCF80D6|nr:MULTISPECIES: Gfo/Idh/MocA family oxidoreductase [unclassified Chelatococcus]MBS7701023.1 Gfo/Idh/MocA family oxidoreductase [Chelatococcus sp. YT9]MBX3555556.1 Gfo/Idh/MocA family oxidoreductase [Chelatococcus sp.]